MKKYIAFIIIIFVFLFNCTLASAQKLTNESIYDTFNDKISQFNKKTSSDINTDNLDKLQSDDIFKLIKNKLIDGFDISFNVIARILFCVILIMIIDALTNNKSISEISIYGCYFVCSYIILENFNYIYNLCISTLNIIIDFMNLTVPVYASSLVISGYISTSSAIQSVFIAISLFITNMIVKIVMPILYYLGIVSVISCVISIIDVDRIIKLIFKTSKYIIGVIMTIFAGILSFTGINAVTNDTLAYKTAKYAVANFVPVVGACLSESIGAITYSSIALKNKIGYMGFIILVIISVIPILKIALMSFIYKFTGASIGMISKNRISSTVELVGEVITTMLSMIIFVTVICLLIIGIIMGIGML